jgi:hypothetical protein
MTTTIKDVEALAEEKLTNALKELNLLPQGYQLSVRLHGESRDKRQNASFEKNWDPETDSIHITFERISLVTQRPAQTLAPTDTTVVPPMSHGGGSDKISDLIRALDRAEARPGYGFVALKWFRDTALPLEGFSWTNVDSERRRVLSEAIERRLILLNKIPNPKSPQFPVTTIRLNRLMPEVKIILGNQDMTWTDFQPVSMRGENLSATVVRDRR